MAFSHQHGALAMLINKRFLKKLFDIAEAE